MKTNPEIVIFAGGIILLIALFGGDPDIADGIINILMGASECNSIQ